MPPPVPIPLFRRLAAELLGTFALVFAGCGAVAADQLSHGGVGPVGIALTFGLIVMVMIHAVGDVSGAHLNPAVTIGFWAARRFPASLVAPYAAAQAAGALAAALALDRLAPGTTLGVTRPAIPLASAFLLEVLLTSLLMFVILTVSTGSREQGPDAGLAVGAVIALAALFAGPLTGASMNPARSLGPALASGHLEALWLYLVAPVAGALVGVMGCKGVRDGACCAVGEGCK